MLCLRPCCSNGHEGISRSLIRVTVLTSEHEFVHSLPKVSRSFSFHGLSKYCLRFSTSPCSCSSLALWYSYRTLISPFLSWCYHGSGSAWVSMDASHSCQFFATTARTILRFHHRCGSLFLLCDVLSFRLLRASICWCVLIVKHIGEARALSKSFSTNFSRNLYRRVCRGEPRKLL